MKAINKPHCLYIIDDFILNLVHEIDVKRTKIKSIPTHGGNRDTRQGRRLPSPTLRKNKKPISIERSFWMSLQDRCDRQDWDFLYIVLQTLFFNSTIFKKVFYKIFVLFVLK